MIAEVWEALRQDSSRDSGVVMRRIAAESPIAVFAGMHKPRNAPMLVVHGVPNHPLLLQLLHSEPSGFSICAGSSSPQPSDVQEVALELLEVAGEPVFLALVDYVVARLEAAPDADAAAVSFMKAITLWQSFFRLHGFSGLSRECQQGLFGELEFLRTRVAEAGSTETAVKSWAGPAGSNQDFQWGGHAFEVKTTVSNPLTAIRVSNLRQLDDECVDSLHLVVIEAERHENDPRTLPAAVEAVRALISATAPQAALEFSDRLVEYGYLDQHSSRYLDVGYGVRAIRYFEVRDDFPRLVEAGVPVGVGDVRYSLALSALSAFEVDPQAMSEQMGAWFGDLG